jgi:hypothetical protein
MRLLACAALVLVVAGCAPKREPGFSSISEPGIAGGSSPGSASPPKTNHTPVGAPIFTPDISLAGKVVRVNEGARFVVLEFPIGRMAQIDQRLFVYHNGLKSGEVKITGPQKDDRIVADLVTGEAFAGDEVRDK